MSDMNTELEEIRARAERSRPWDTYADETREFNSKGPKDVETLLSHISTLEERIAFLEKVIKQMGDFSGVTFEAAESGFYVTRPGMIKTHYIDEIPLAEYLRTQGGKS